MTAQIEIGDRAPDFELSSDLGETVRLEDLRGRWIVLFFYPKAMTPGCTTEACDFQDVHFQLRSMGAEILGISPDSTERLQRFRKKNGLGFPLLSDPEHRAAEAYGVWSLKKMAGREYMGIVRSTFLIDPEGRIAAVWRKVRVKDHVKRVLSKLEELRAESGTA